MEHRAQKCAQPSIIRAFIVIDQIVLQTRQVLEKFII